MILLIDLQKSRRDDTFVELSIENFIERCKCDIFQTQMSHLRRLNCYFLF